MSLLSGYEPTAIPDASLLDGWWVADGLQRDLEAKAIAALDVFHRAHPLLPGMEGVNLRAAMFQNERGSTVPEDVVAAILASLEREGLVARQGTLLRRGGHSVSLDEREEEATRLIEIVESGEPTPPTQRDLAEKGFPRELIEACVTTGLLARVSADVVLTPAFLSRAETLARTEAEKPGGLTVSRFREMLGTTRKYALPILGSFDDRGITRRDGDVRRLRD